MESGGGQILGLNHRLAIAMTRVPGLLAVVLVEAGFRPQW